LACVTVWAPKTHPITSFHLDATCCEGPPGETGKYAGYWCSNKPIPQGAQLIDGNEVTVSPTGQKGSMQRSCITFPSAAAASYSDRYCFIDGKQILASDKDIPIDNHYEMSFHTVNGNSVQGCMVVRNKTNTPVTFHLSTR
jgi:hypothetical protein